MRHELQGHCEKYGDGRQGQKDILTLERQNHACARQLQMVRASVQYIRLRQIRHVQVHKLTTSGKSHSAGKRSISKVEKMRPPSK